MDSSDIQSVSVLKVCLVITYRVHGSHTEKAAQSVFKWALNIPKEECFRASLYNLFQNMTILMVQKLIPLFQWIFLYISLLPFPLVTSPDTTEKKLAYVSYSCCQIFILTAKIFFLITSLFAHAQNRFLSTSVGNDVFVPYSQLCQSLNSSLQSSERILWSEKKQITNWQLLLYNCLLTCMIHLFSLMSFFLTTFLLTFFLPTGFVRCQLGSHITDYYLRTML